MAQNVDQNASEALLEGLRRWVEFETPTGRVDVIGRLLDHIVAEAQPLGCAI